MSIQDFSITLHDAPPAGFGPGDGLRGTVHLLTTKSMVVDTVRLQLLGVTLNQLQTGVDDQCSTTFFRIQNDLWHDGYSEAASSYSCGGVGTASEASVIQAGGIERPRCDSGYANSVAFAATHREPDAGTRCSSESSSLASQTSTAKSHLGPGRHQWSFQLHFPDAGIRLPSSFEDRYSYIRYELRVSLLRPYGYSNVDRTVPLQYADNVNIASNRLQIPVHFRKELLEPKGSVLGRLVGMHSTTAGPPVADVWASVQRSGYLPGESIRVLVEVRHTQPCYLPDAVQVCLVQECTAHLRGQTAVSRTTMAKQTAHLHVSAEANMRAVIPVVLELPAELALTNAAMRTLHVTYQLQISVRVTEAKRFGVCAAELGMPVTIGRVCNEPNSQSAFGDAMVNVDACESCAQDGEHDVLPGYKQQDPNPSSSPPAYSDSLC
ncbi:hypothetical protein THASP1DRAFT_26534 [Thamnocephalis sphaerospora]|uniref:Arrestin C-terminal-like domain-containing protein n=1 Tax=Thamnocephalis sphaerospora TaxID=78915 RepID=A0A4P9XGW8_9FUNG|nr:hypothetical protein THASP1DRAFT_26534 [Thamnocephalis sphaerospora]|eukprot:RKP04896.1 hypothetical protein THASP1DRAFT_26534 [Thamnocephalis sphaerospora]